MLKITRQDLRNKTKGQLAALFNQASQELKSKNRLGQAFKAAQAALKLILDELSHRTPIT